jgi:DsbC/DsbD-like thiol-disulfide interchange protein
MRFIIFTVLLISTFGLSAQADSKVKWDFSSRKSGNDFQLVMTATLESGWHIYSQFLKGDGPIPTTFEFTVPAGVKLKDKVKEPEPIKYFDENFGMEVLYFNNKVEFVQSVNGKKIDGKEIEGKVNFMVCDDHMCYPPVDVPFKIKL